MACCFWKKDFLTKNICELLTTSGYFILALFSFAKYNVHYFLHILYASFKVFCARHWFTVVLNQRFPSLLRSSFLRRLFRQLLLRFQTHYTAAPRPRTHIQTFEQYRFYITLPQAGARSILRTLLLHFCLYRNVCSPILSSFFMMFQAVLIVVMVFQIGPTINAHSRGFARMNGRRHRFSMLPTRLFLVRFIYLTMWQFSIIRCRILRNLCIYLYNCSRNKLQWLFNV